MKAYEIDQVFSQVSSIEPLQLIWRRLSKHCYEHYEQAVSQVWINKVSQEHQVDMRPYLSDAFLYRKWRNWIFSSSAVPSDEDVFIRYKYI